MSTTCAIPWQLGAKLRDGALELLDPLLEGAEPVELDRHLGCGRGGLVFGSAE